MPIHPSNEPTLKTWIFRGILFSLPWLLLLLIELGLNVIGYGHNLDLFERYEEQDGFLTPNPEGVRRYFPSSEMSSFGGEDVFKSGG